MPGSTSGVRVISQGFAWWSFDSDLIDEHSLLERAWEVGMRGIDFLPQRLWKSAKEIGFEVLTIDGHPSIDYGLNNPLESATILDQLRTSIDLAHENGINAVTIASGLRNGIPRTVAIETMINTVLAVSHHAEESNVSVLLEPLNSRYDHPGHQCDTVEFAEEVIRGTGSSHVNLLFDVYHVQIMQGDVTNRIRSCSDILGHVHTAGVPGRGEIGLGQEINYRWIASLLKAIDYGGWIVHEFVPRAHPILALNEAYSVFDNEE
ncbi:TIM barrel protein [Brevibacterium sediminis]|uniref:TIM barrel protein n=1 Tax=Brevibacterium sediminis TaxID=1857024 RepID=UPI00217510A8|nr:TIM barrel protein [Brevibacterium sediminis]MCS4592674.1 TIM barrel protein [Brevibacterium sediminis]